MPVHFRSFFTKGKLFRVPMFFASSFELGRAMYFAQENSSMDKPPLRFEILFEPPTWEGGMGCVHALFIAAVSAVACELEFLMPPYSAFEVIEEPILEDPSNGKCSIIKLRALHDNRMAPR